MQISKFLVALAALIPLCGFYVTEQPVLDAGDCIPEAAGKFVCEADGKAIRANNSEIKSGLFSRSCVYRDDVINADTFNKRSPTGLILQQTRIQNFYSYGFVQTVDVNSFQSLTAAPGTTDYLLNQFHVSARRVSGTPFVMLQGSRDNLAQFLLAHGQNHVDVVGTCQRQK